MNYTIGKKDKLLLGAITLGLASSLGVPVQAQDSFASSSIQFVEDTIIEFEFLESHGAYQATLGIKNETTGEEKVLFRELKPYDSFGTGQRESSSTGNDNVGTRTDFIGTVGGGTISNQFQEFLFKADNRYSFFLESVSPSGQTRRTVVSTNNFARFAGDLNGGKRGSITGVRVGWEDGGQVEVGNDSDFDDFIIEAGGYLISCPRL